MSLLLRACSGQRLLLHLRPNHVRWQRTQQIARQQANQQPSSQLRAKHLLIPLACTIGFVECCQVGSIIWRHENIIKLKDERFKKIKSQFWKDRQDVRQEKSALGRLRKWYHGQGDGFQAFLGIFALNALVFFAWRIPSFRPTMMKYFVTSCEGNRIRFLPMILSNFSHNSGIHFGLNMFVLYSFSNLSVNTIGKENFFSLYMSSGVVSSFASYVYKVFVGGLAPSLGASGAILGVLASCCVERPDIQLMIVFLPFFSFSSAVALKAIIAFDSLGCLLRWAFFDHAAHLGGALYGIYDSKRKTTEYYEWKRKLIIRSWEKFKNPAKK